MAALHFEQLLFRIFLSMVEYGLSMPIYVWRGIDVAFVSACCWKTGQERLLSRRKTAAVRYGTGH